MVTHYYQCSKSLEEKPLLVQNTQQEKNSIRHCSPCTPKQQVKSFLAAVGCLTPLHRSQKR